jgi:hypothetical protein
MSLIAVILGALVVALAAIGVVFVVGMRRKSPTVLRVVRRFARAVVNPRVLATAGTPGPYETPVVAERTGDGFVIALPYGTTANWVQNVLARGSATIVDEGTTYRVDRPEIVPLALMADYFPSKDRRNLDRFRVDQCLRLRRSDRHDPSPDVVADAARAAEEAGRQSPSAARVRVGDREAR